MHDGKGASDGALDAPLPGRRPSHARARRALPLIVAALLLASGLFVSLWLRRSRAGAVLPPLAALSAGARDVRGGSLSTAALVGQSATVVVFVGVECPIGNAYLKRLGSLQERFAGQGVRFVAVDSNTQDDRDEVRAHAEALELPVPLLYDDDHRIVDSLGAKLISETFVLDRAGKVVYHGRIDDQYGIGYTRPAPLRSDLIEALNELLAGKPISVPSTEVAGCFIGREKIASRSTTITYGAQVARILRKSCEPCHQTGGPSPFALSDYGQVTGWADTIRDVVSSGRMPPWRADPRYGHFVNDRRLSPEDRATLLSWIDAGCARGDAAELPPPLEPLGPDHWRIGKPDVVLSMPRPFDVPAKGPPAGIPYQHYTLATTFDHDVWVSAVETRSTFPRAVHHVMVQIKRQDDDYDTWSSDGEMLVTSAQVITFPPGTAKKIARGDSLIMEIHYQANGTAQPDLTSFGLILGPKPTNELRYRNLRNKNLEIPPGKADYRLDAGVTLERPTRVWTIRPHMHLRGKSAELRATYPDGHTEILLSVPSYDTHQQTEYFVDAPPVLPVGTRLECTGIFDNSAANPNNPDPTATVRWGLQTWDEMLSCWVHYTEEPSGAPAAP